MPLIRLDKVDQLNLVLWNNKVTKKTKKTLYKTIVKSICTYSAATWELKKYQKSRFLSLEMDFWRSSSQVSQLHYNRNDQIREIMKVDYTIFETIESKSVISYGHLQRMPEN